MKRVLVTGAAGFIGFHLAKSLADDGLSVILVDNFKRGVSDQEFAELISRENVEFIPIDMTSAEEVMGLPRDVEQVFHLAAINGTKNFYEIPDQVLRVNVLATINLLEWAKTCNHLKIVYTSSSEAYAGTVERDPGLVPTPESVPLSISDVSNVRWSYGASKLLGECAMFAYGSTTDLEFSVVRYHNIYGPRMGFDHVIPQFMQRATDGELPLKVYGSSQTRAFCYVTDAVKATRLVMDSEHTDREIFHIGNSDEEVKIQDLAKLVLKTLNLPDRITPLDAPAGSVSRRCPDTRKMQKLGFTPSVDLGAGLKTMAEWYSAYFEASSK